MRRLPLILIALGLAGFGAVRALDQGVAAERVRREPPAWHFPTVDQLVNSGARVGQPAPVISGVAQDGREYELAKLAGDKPVVLAFIKDGCPCFAEAEPYFARLRSAYGERFGFVGVIDGPVEAAGRFAKSVGVSYPVLADPGANAARRYGVTHAVSIVLVRPGGAIDAQWPGYSAEMLLELNRRIARLTEVSEPPLDVAGAPAAITSGCPFPLPQESKP